MPLRYYLSWSINCSYAKLNFFVKTDELILNKVHIETPGDNTTLKMRPGVGGRPPGIGFKPNYKATAMNTGWPTDQMTQ